MAKRYLKQCRFLHAALFALALVVAGCRTPIGADRVPVRAAYAQVEENALSAGTVSSATESLLHRYDVEAAFEENPDAGITQLHLRAVATGDRDLLYALAETSFVAGQRISKSVKPWDTRDPRDYYLGSAVYAWLFLFGDGNSPRPSAFDRRFRSACDLYNFSLGMAFTHPDDTNAVFKFEAGKRRLPVGTIDISIGTLKLPWTLDTFEEFHVSDQFKIRGLSTRNRQPGLGATLIGVRKKTFEVGIRPMAAATALLRIEGSLKSLSDPGANGSLELHSAFGTNEVKIAGQTVPLETDVTAHLGFALNQSIVWRLEKMQFLSLQEVIPADVYLAQPYERGRIPVVFVHGTFSSPVWWAEMLNTLRADPTLRQRYQFWYFIYNSSNPLVISAYKLRQGIKARLKAVDPEGTDAALNEMVLIGHSQGGLLTKMAVTDAEDKLWNAVSKKPIDEVDYTEAQREKVRELVFLKPLPYVRRAIFISTPHRGSYRAGNFVRNITRRLVSIPKKLVTRAEEFNSLKKELDLPKEYQGIHLTSLDGMSSKNPLLQALVEIPVAPNIKAHSIIPVKGTGDFRTGTDGIVKYESAHVDYVESELVVRHGHSVQSTPAAIEEVRRILHEHLQLQGSGESPTQKAPSQAAVAR